MVNTVNFKVNPIDSIQPMETTIDGKRVSCVSGFNVKIDRDTVIPEANIVVNGEFLESGFDIEFPIDNVKVCVVEDKADQRYYDFFKQMETYFKQNVDIEKARFLNKTERGEADGFSESERHLANVKSLLITCERERQNKENTKQKKVS
jgi:hypothetical protein